ncbi:MAG: hypothetical protein HRT69_18735 [Flavobacteriaceae bacterium]|nr:hypothetical protein [Flavobacteriaceae bacterium]
MNAQYSIFKKFPTLEQAQEIEKLLNDNNIETIIADNVPPVDVTFAGNTIGNEIEIRIKQLDFKNASSIIEKENETLIENVDPNYYLLKFTNEELYDILLKSDEWGDYDYSLAQQLLTERGKPVDKDLLSSLKKERIKDLAKPEKNQKPWILAGYLFSILGGFLGLIIGYFLWTSKKTLPNGQKVYSYLPNDRKHGKYIFFIGLIVLPIGLILKVANS